MYIEALCIQSHASERTDISPGEGAPSGVCSRMGPGEGKGVGLGKSSDDALCPTPQAGTLKIIDRKKHIFKLAQGEYVAPEKIENIYIRCEPVSQIYVHGDSLKVSILASR